MYRPGACKALPKQIRKYKLNIVAIQETKWLGNEIIDMGSYTILKSGKASGNREFGVAFIVDKTFKLLIIDFKPINEKLCAIRIKTNFTNIWLN